MMDRDVEALLGPLERAYREATPDWVQGGDSGRHLLAGGPSDGGVLIISFYDPAAGHEQGTRNTALAALMHRSLPELILRLREAEGLLADMALDGMPVALVRKYRRALTRIANLDPRAANPRRFAYEALIGEAVEEDDEGEQDAKGWVAFCREVGRDAAVVLARLGVHSFEELEATPDTAFTAIGEYYVGHHIHAIYQTLARFGRPRSDPGRLAPTTAPKP